MSQGRAEQYSVKRVITNALINLMREKSYMDITVTDIIVKAEVARASFYRNFDSVSDVIDAFIDKFAGSFIENIYPALKSADDGKIREFLFDYFSHLADNQNRIFGIHPQNMTVLLARIDTKIRAAGLVMEQGSVSEKYAPFGKLGFINSVAKRWLNDGMKETSEEIIDYIMSVITLF